MSTGLQSDNILVTGGAGYIGSHTVLQLVDTGYQVVVLDDLSTGHKWAVSPEAQLIQGDVGNTSLVGNLIEKYEIGSVIHFAGHIVVPESVDNPAKYYSNNVLGSLNLIETCISKGVGQFVFSSSAAVYGSPQRFSVSEQDETTPINPYGSTKLITEWTLRDLAAAQDSFNFAALRYFNVAGAHMGGEVGQATPNATHLIKVSCEAAYGKRPNLAIFGDDYDTVDGTCIRDYIHVDDLASAHLAALDYLKTEKNNQILNCGYGRGFSVKEVVDCVKAVSGVDFSVKIEPRRTGDPPQLVADNSKIKQVLNWNPKYNDLAVICQSAYLWEGQLAAKSGTLNRAGNK